MPPSTACFEDKEAVEAGAVEDTTPWRSAGMIEEAEIDAALTVGLSVRGWAGSRRVACRGTGQPRRTRPRGRLAGIIETPCRGGEPL